jgi:hypothetical protein
MEAAKEGISHEELVDKIHSWIPKIRIYVAVQTVKYMVRGGRLSPMKGFIANMLNLKPIISFDKEGRAFSFNKSFGRRNNLKKIKRMIRKHLYSNKLWNYALIYSDPGESQRASEYADKLKSLIGRSPAFVESIAPVVGVNAGPGTIAVMLMLE